MEMCPFQKVSASFTTKQLDVDFDELYVTLSNPDMKIKGIDLSIKLIYLISIST